MMFKYKLQHIVDKVISEGEELLQQDLQGPLAGPHA